FFVGAIQEPLQGSSRRGSRSIQQLQRMLEAVDGLVERPVVVSSVAVYDKTDLVLAIQSAAENFHDGWRARLGKAVKPAVSKEHWTRIKALTRRIAEGWADEYDTLKPVADLHYRSLFDSIHRRGSGVSVGVMVVTDAGNPLYRMTPRTDDSSVH